MSISSGYLGWFAVLATICAAVFYRTSVSSAVTTSRELHLPYLAVYEANHSPLLRASLAAEFRKFQTLFLSVYLTMVTADWLQVSRINSDRLNVSRMSLTRCGHAQHYAGPVCVQAVCGVRL